MSSTSKKRVSKFPYYLALFVAVILVTIAGLFLYTQKAEEAKVSSDAYHAVFLSNGQVYFGKLSDKNKKYVVLEDIYYLRLNEGTADATLQDKDVSLIKFGSELHKPVDRIEINQSQILFIEELRDDSNIIEAIKGYQAED